MQSRPHHFAQTNDQNFHQDSPIFFQTGFSLTENTIQTYKEPPLDVNTADPGFIPIRKRTDPATSIQYLIMQTHT